MLDDQAHILQVAHARVRAPEPKTLRVRPDQRGGALDQSRRRRRGRRQFVQFIGRGSHEHSLPSLCRQGKMGARGRRTGMRSEFGLLAGCDS
jgi:hypothetical protein